MHDYTRTSLALLLALGAVGSLAGASACGGDDAVTPGIDGGVGFVDAHDDARGPADTGTDAPRDATAPLDAPADVGRDAAPDVLVDSGQDAAALTDALDEAAVDGASADAGSDAQLDAGSDAQADAAQDASADAPAGDGGAAPKVVFVTSVAYDGNLGGLAGADAKCQDLAGKAGLAGTFLAWLSDSTSSPSTRNSRAAGDYVRTDGQVVAHGWSDLTDAKILVPIDLTEDGGAPPTTTAAARCSIPQPAVWSDTLPDGTRWTTDPQSTCADWTSNASTGAEFESVGSGGLADSRWIEACSFSACTYTAALYCVEQ